MKIHLVDGTYELFRNYFGAPPKKAPNGQEVGATLGLLRSLLMLLTSPGVTHVGVAFDHVIESFRNDLYAGYKTGEGVDPNLLAQFPLAEKAVSALGVVVWPMVKFEADDALATATARFKKNKTCGADCRLFAGQGFVSTGGRQADRVLGPPPRHRPGRARVWSINSA